MGDRSDYGNNIEGVPLPGDIPQVQGSAVPNREDSPTLQNPQGEALDEAPLDYVTKESKERDGGPFVDSKDDEQWSPGIEDEENSGFMSFSEQDKNWTEGVFPETEPLNVQGDADEQSSEELSHIELRPDNIQNGPE
ncbi:MAG TPA: hypothetical protein V6D22_22600 [Candidatus Obscuribacterales bacterium]